MCVRNLDFSAICVDAKDNHFDHFYLESFYFCCRTAFIDDYKQSE